jgi:hypothetical protein
MDGEGIKPCHGWGMYLSVFVANNNIRPTDGYKYKVRVCVLKAKTEKSINLPPPRTHRPPAWPRPSRSAAACGSRVLSIFSLVFS